MNASKKIDRAAKLLAEALTELKRGIKIKGEEGIERNHYFENTLEMAINSIKGLAETYKDSY